MPKITVEYKTKDRMAEFVGLLKDRAMDEAYEPVRDVIADFVDKFLVVELKRLNSSNETRTEELDIPQDVLLEPLRQARSAVDEQFRKLLGGESIVPAVKTKDNTDTKTEEEEVKTKRNGNGHARKKVRDLTDPERDQIKMAFMNCNGQIEEDKCVEIKKDLDAEVAIFQVTGFVSYLHNQIAAGKMVVADMNAYLDFLQGHRDLWAKYDSPKYRAMRKLNTATATV